MVLIGISDQDEETAVKYPGIRNHERCKPWSFIPIIFALIVGIALGLTASYLILLKYPNFSPLYNIVIMAAVVITYLVASTASKQCQRLWVNTAKQVYPAGTEARQLSLTQADTESTKIHLIPDEAASERLLGATKYGDQAG